MPHINKSLIQPRGKETQYQQGPKANEVENDEE